MPTQQVPHDQWEVYLAEFSARNQTRPVIVDMETSELGQERLVDSAPLLGIEPDFKDEYQKSITIIAGDPEGAEPEALTHQVMNPRTIWIKEDDQGCAEALDIEMEGGRTIIQFI